MERLPLHMPEDASYSSGSSAVRPSASGNKRDMLVEMLAWKLGRASRNAQKKVEKSSNPQPSQASLEAECGKSRSSASGTSAAKEECAKGKLLTFEVSGTIGVKYHPETGRIEEVKSGGKAKELGVQIGWEIRILDDIPYSDDLLKQKIAGNVPFQLTFWREAAPGDQAREIDRLRSEAVMLGAQNEALGMQVDETPLQSQLQKLQKAAGSIPEDELPGIDCLSDSSSEVSQADQDKENDDPEAFRQKSPFQGFPGQFNWQDWAKASEQTIALKYCIRLKSASKALQEAREELTVSELARCGAEKELEESKARACCCICMVRPRSIVTTPCHHLVMCDQCVVGLHSCPVCRADIGGAIDVVLA